MRLLDQAMLLSVILMAAGTPVYAQRIIDTRITNRSLGVVREINQDGNAMNGFYGSMGGGQRFTALAGSTAMNSFSFWLTALHPGHGCQDGCDPDLEFRGYLFAWDVVENRAVGPAVYESAIQNAPLRGTPPQEYRFDTGNLTLTPNQVYIAVISAGAELRTDGYGLGPGPGGWLRIPRGMGMLTNYGTQSPSASYPGGGFVAMRTGGYGWANGVPGLAEGRPVSLPSSTITTMTQWTPDETHVMDPGYGEDAEFVAVFSDANTTVTPEPATLFLLGSGLAGLRALRRRRRNPGSGA